MLVIYAIIAVNVVVLVSAILRSLLRGRADRRRSQVFTALTQDIVNQYQSTSKLHPWIPNLAQERLQSFRHLHRWMATLAWEEIRFFFPQAEEILRLHVDHRQLLEMRHQLSADLNQRLRDLHRLESRISLLIFEDLMNNQALREGLARFEFEYFVSNRKLLD